MELGAVQDAEAKRVELTTKTAAETAEKARLTVEEAQLTIIISNLYETRMRTHHSPNTPMHGPSLSSIILMQIWIVRLHVQRRMPQAIAHLVLART
jgi:hypothetical protein